MDHGELEIERVPPASSNLKLSLSRSLGSPASSKWAALDQQPSTSAKQPAGHAGSFQRFEHYRFGAASTAKPPKAPDALPPEEFASICAASAAQANAKRKRLGRLNEPISIQRPSVLQASVGRGFGGGNSFAQARRRPVLFDDSDEDGDDQLDVALNKRRAAKPAVQERVVGLEEDDDGDYVDLSEDDSPIDDRPSQHQPAMRQKIDLRHDYGPRMPVLEEVGTVLEKDDSDEVLRRCEEISISLRKALGGNGNSDKYAALEEGKGLVTQELLSRACGDAARYIKPYQLVGINFLMLLEREGVEGAALCDEMGLGKTAQAICFLGILRELSKDAGPHLVVVPASLIENWQRELERWCPKLEVVTYYGKDRAEMRANLNTLRDSSADVTKLDSDSQSESDEEYLNEEDVQKHERAVSGQRASTASREGDRPPPFNLMLTCYTLFERDSDEQRLDRSFLKKWRWSHMILDEAHAVKNASATRTIRLNRVAACCRRRIMLTGTPLQNDLGELQNLLQFLMPKLFSQEEAGKLQDVKEEAEIDRLAERMKNLLRPFVLRRLKTEVANQLVPKQHKLHCLPMTPEQAQLYADSLAAFQADIRAAAPAAVDSLESEADKAKRLAQAAKAVKKLGSKTVGNIFTHLRKVALHPLLVRHLFSEDQVAHMARIARQRGVFGEQASEARIKEELMGYGDFALHSLALNNGKRFASFVLNEAHIYSSAKCKLLAKLLPELKAVGSRPLIFSQWTQVLDLLEWLLQCLRLPYVRLDGSTAVAERLTTVDMFNNPANGVFAFLLSTRAGGQGLNLTGADTVILHDVDFNPQIDRQAEDRCHRLGQMKPVTVIRLVTQGTVDEGINALAQKKLRLDAAVLEGITSTGGGKASETQAMGELLQSLIAGDPAGRPMGEDMQPIVVQPTEPVPLELTEAAAALEPTPGPVGKQYDSEAEDGAEPASVSAKDNGKTPGSKKKKRREGTPRTPAAKIKGASSQVKMGSKKKEASVSARKGKRKACSEVVDLTNT